MDSRASRSDFVFNWRRRDGFDWFFRLLLRLFQWLEVGEDFHGKFEGIELGGGRWSRWSCRRGGSRSSSSRRRACRRSSSPCCSRWRERLCRFGATSSARGRQRWWSSIGFSRCLMNWFRRCVRLCVWKFRVNCLSNLIIKIRFFSRIKCSFFLFIVMVECVLFF